MGAVAIEHVQERFGVYRSVGYELVARLVEAGLMERVATLPGDPALLCATQQGIAYAGLGLPVARVAPGQVDHWLACADAGIWAERRWGKDSLMCQSASFASRSSTLQSRSRVRSSAIFRAGRRARCNPIATTADRPSGRNSSIAGGSHAAAQHEELAVGTLPLSFLWRRERPELCFAPARGEYARRRDKLLNSLALARGACILRRHRAQATRAARDCHVRPARCDKQSVRGRCRRRLGCLGIPQKLGQAFGNVVGVLESDDGPDAWQPFDQARRPCALRHDQLRLAAERRHAGLDRY
jgi:hypothetical protein